jgi:hypothetical protein
MEVPPASVDFCNTRAIRCQRELHSCCKEPSSCISDKIVTIGVDGCVERAKFSAGNAKMWLFQIVGPLGCNDTRRDKKRSVMIGTGGEGNVCAAYCG